LFRNIAATAASGPGSNDDRSNWPVVDHAARLVARPLHAKPNIVRALPNF
jgi:hypothetical protein